MYAMIAELGKINAFEFHVNAQTLGVTSLVDAGDGCNQSLGGYAPAVETGATDHGIALYQYYAFAEFACAQCRRISTWATTDYRNVSMILIRLR
jgi:hypothetical protein